MTEAIKLNTGTKTIRILPTPQKLSAHAGQATFFGFLALRKVRALVAGLWPHRPTSPNATKPVEIALAMDQGLIHPRSMVVDTPRHFGGYNPENYDGEFAGPISATDALARSRNVPAVALAAQFVRPTFYEFLKCGGVALPHEEAFYGLALPLGGGEVTMEELVRIYAALANGGRLRPLRRTLFDTPELGVRLVSPETAFLALEMLGHVPRPGVGSAAGSEGVYWKTGTSMGFRDAWSVAVFDHYVLAVWVGNFDGRRNPAFIGRTCAGPLLFQVIDTMRLQGRARPPPSAALRARLGCGDDRAHRQAAADRVAGERSRRCAGQR